MMTVGNKDSIRKRGSLYLILAGLASVVLVGVLIASQPEGTPLDWGIRATALLGHLAVFLTALSVVYMRELYKLLGRPFIKLHHIVAVAGLILITLHPLGVALRSSDLRVFLPDFSSAYAFFSLGGRPAWYLIGVASLAALFRASMKGSWRLIHYLNYVAFFLATAHAILIGTDFQSFVMHGVAVGLALVLVGVFAHKRLQRRRISQRK